jgi:dienelactone hydrolase
MHTNQLKLQRVSPTFIILFLFIFSTFSLTAQQKRAVEPEDYPGIQNITKKGISDKGRYVYYVISPMQYGDPMIVLHDLKLNRTDTIPRAKKIWFSSDPWKGAWYAYLREPAWGEVRAAKLKDPKAAEKFDDTLVIVAERKKEIKELVYPAVKSVIEPSEGSSRYMAILIKIKKEEKEHNDTIPATEGDINDQRRPAGGAAKKGDDKRYTMVLVDPASGHEIREEYVTHATWSPWGNYLAWVQQPVDSLPAQHLHEFDIYKKTSSPLYLSEGVIRNVAFSWYETTLAFLEQPDTADETSSKVMFRDHVLSPDFREIEPPAGMVFNPHHPIVFLESTAGRREKQQPEGQDQRGSYMESTDRIVIPLAYPSKKPAKDSLLKEEKYMLDIWGWDDPYLQSQQLKQLDSEKKRAYRMVYDIPAGTMVQLEDSLMRNAIINTQQTKNLVLLRDELKYAVESTWKGYSRADIYLLNLTDDSRKLISEGHERHMSLSPGEAWIVWYDRNDSTWKGIDTRSEKMDPFCITCGIKASFHDDEYDNPGPAPAYGIAGWGSNSRYVLLNSKFDVWRIDMQQQQPPLCLTSDGGETGSKVYRIIHLEKRKWSYNDKDRILLHVFDRQTKASGVAELYYHKPGKPSMLFEGDYRYSGFEKASKGNQLIWTRESFSEFPEVWTDSYTLMKPRKLSNIGQQYDKFYRGTQSLVRWQGDDGEWYAGLLAIPENSYGFEKLPMIVTFYERSSDDLNRFSHIVPSRSVVNTSYYLSHGYMVFEPDIHYRIGTPGEDAVRSVVSGTRHVISLGKVDPARIGIQGQSWGGYQVAYIITQTDMFAAAMAGAAVSNMTSAYGAIRNESGRARLFQYEEGQSRIGGSMWDKGALPLYLGNSPLFLADIVNTPLLMMHNDNDGAVPWSQSVEYYLALRRLGKPAWLLVYNNEAHNLGKWPNRVDLSIRMKQFFDHYLKDAPAPQWMTKGRPAISKEFDDAYGTGE